MATYSKLVVDLSPDLYTGLCDAARGAGISRAQVVRALIHSYLLEIESHPSGKAFGGEKEAIITAPLRKTARLRRKNDR